MRLLIIDSDPDVVTVLQGALEARGYRVLSASEVREAYGLLSICDIDGVVLDLFEPQMQAYELLKTMRAEGHTRTVPVLLLSSTEDAKERIRALLLGANDYLSKPVDPKEVVQRVEKMVVQRSASPGGLFGPLTDTGLFESLQGLEEEKGSGVVRIFGDVRDGWIELVEGQLATARYGLLEGWPAVLAMLTIGDGHFIFEPRTGTEPPPEPAMGPAYSLPSLELRLAQLRDRLRRFKVYLPQPDVSLEVCGSLGPELAALEDIPYAEVYERIGALPGLTLGELLAHELAPAIHVQLALAILIKTSVIAARK